MSPRPMKMPNTHAARTPNHTFFGILLKTLLCLCFSTRMMCFPFFSLFFSPVKYTHLSKDSTCARPAIISDGDPNIGVGIEGHWKQLSPPVEPPTQSGGKWVDSSPHPNSASEQRDVFRTYFWGGGGVTLPTEPQMWRPRRYPRFISAQEKSSSGVYYSRTRKNHSYEFRKRSISFLNQNCLSFFSQHRSQKVTASLLSLVSGGIVLLTSGERPSEWHPVAPRFPPSQDPRDCALEVRGRVLYCLSSIPTRTFLKADPTPTPRRGGGGVQASREPARCPFPP